jgi:hypothetical protein
MELYLHCPNTPSWRGAELKKAQGQLYLFIDVYRNNGRNLEEKNYFKS